MFLRALLILFVTLNLYAEGSARSFYLGVGSGLLKYDDGGLLKNEFRVEHDSSGLGYFKFYGGYQLHRVIAIEASVFYYLVENRSDGYNYRAQGGFIGPNLGLTFYQRQIRVFAVLGLSLVSSQHQNVEDISDDMKTSLAFHYGLGITYEPRNFNHIGFRLALERDTFSTYIEDNIGYSYETASYRQNLNQLYLGAQYKF